MKTYSGSIFARGGRLYIKHKDRGVWKSSATGLLDTPQNRKELARQLTIQPTKAETFTAHSIIEEYISLRSVDLHERTIKDYRNQLFAVLPIDAPLTQAHVQQSLQAYARKNLSARTIHNTLTAFYTMWKYMSELYALPSIPTRRSIYRKPVATKKIRTFTKQEFLLLHDYFASKTHVQKGQAGLIPTTAFAEFAVLLSVMFYTGARWVDVSNLTWADVTEHSIKWRNKRTKHEEEVPCAKHILDALQTLPRTSKYVFRWRHGSHSRCAKWLRSACIELNIEPRSFHEIRKSFATRVFSKELNLPIKDALTLVRHKTVDTTIKHYLDTSEALQIAVEKI